MLLTGDNRASVSCRLNDCLLIHWLDGDTVDDADFHPLFFKFCRGKDHVMHERPAGDDDHIWLTLRIPENLRLPNLKRRLLGCKNRSFLTCKTDVARAIHF